MLAALGIAKCKSFAPEVDARKLLDLAANSIHDGTRRAAGHCAQ